LAIPTWQLTTVHLMHWTAFGSLTLHWNTLVENNMNNFCQKTIWTGWEPQLIKQQVGIQPNMLDWRNW
jgi:hypothetical protein